MHESSTGDYERLCEIGQEILGATWQTRWRRTGRAGGLFAAVEGVDRQERTYERCTRDTREFTRDGARNFGRITADGVAGGGRPRRGAGRAQAALEALLRRLKGLTGRSARTRDVREIHGSLREIGQESFRRMTADGRLRATGSRAGCGSGGGRRLGPDRQMNITGRKGSWPDVCAATTSWPRASRIKSYVIHLKTLVAKGCRLTRNR